MYEPSRKDSRLLKRALNQGWNVPVKMRIKIIEVMGQIVAEGKTSREKTSAARAVMQASRLELEAIRLAEAAKFGDVLQRMAKVEEGNDAKLAHASSAT